MFLRCQDSSDEAIFPPIFYHSVVDSVCFSVVTGDLTMSARWNVLNWCRVIGWSDICINKHLCDEVAGEFVFSFFFLFFPVSEESKNLTLFSIYFFPSVFHGRWRSGANVALPSLLLSSCKMLIGAGTRLMTGLTYWGVGSLIYSAYLFLPIFQWCEVEIGNAQPMFRGDIPNWSAITPMGEAQRGVRNLAFSRSVIVSSAGVIWVSGYRVISEADEGRKGERDVITSLCRRRTDEELGSN